MRKVDTFVVRLTSSSISCTRFQLSYYAHTRQNWPGALPYSKWIVPDGVRKMSKGYGGGVGGYLPCAAAFNFEKN
jgi:hypothetical protein